MGHEQIPVSLPNKSPPVHLSRPRWPLGGYTCKLSSEGEMKVGAEHLQTPWPNPSSILVTRSHEIDTSSPPRILVWPWVLQQLTKTASLISTRTSQTRLGVRCSLHFCCHHINWDYYHLKSELWNSPQECLPIPCFAYGALKLQRAFDSPEGRLNHTAAPHHQFPTQ